MVELLPICPDCGNNVCLLDPNIFARKHLRGADKRWYESKKKDVDDFLAEQMTEYERRIKQ